MLVDHGHLADFLLTPALGNSSRPPNAPENLAGTSIGPYQLIQVIGEGGSGIVYLATQSKPLKRQVALKILKAGTNSSEVLARFEAERHTLALMDHPGIAKVLDAGTTENESPFFVMEYVDGHPVTQYCAQDNLPIRSRLEIFIKICRAIEHAHQKGIIHRDLKPSNILVRREDGEPVPKVIDFGVAKAMAPIEGAPLKLTLNSPIIGTPAYMSPEQAAEGRRDIDTRSDIFALGVILFELLTGKTPVEALLKEGEGTKEALGLLKQGHFLRPSSYLEEIPSKAAREVAKERSCSPKRLLTEIRGDLDWVVMTCLDSDRNRRYGNSTDLSRDLELHLEGSPIRARPPSWHYRLGRFVRKNSVAVCLSGILVAALLSTTVVSYYSGVQARKAKETEKALRLRAEQDRSLAVSMSKEARIHQYVAHINLAQQAIIDGHLTKARQLLGKWAPDQSPNGDMRGFEWWYLVEKCAEDEHISLPPFDTPVDSLSFTPDGNLLAVGTRDQVSLWSRKEKRVQSTFPYDGRSVSFSGDGEQLLITGRQGIVVIDLASEALIWELEGNRQRAALASNIPLLATSDGNGTYLWNTDTWEREESFPLAADSLLFSPKTNILAAQNRDGITLLKLGKESLPIELEESSRSSPFRQVFRFSPDGNFLILAKNEDSLQDGFALAVYDVNTGLKTRWLSRDIQTERHSGVISGMGFDERGNQLVTSSWDHSVHIWNFQQGTLNRRLLGHRSEVWSVALSPDGNHVASGSKDGEVRIWPTSKQPKTSTIDGPWEPIGFSKDGSQFTAYHSEGKLTTFLLATGNTVDSTTVDDLPPRSRRGIPVDQQGSRRVEIRGEGIIHVKDLTNNSAENLSLGLPTIDTIQLSQNGKWLATISMREGLRCWDLDSPSTPTIRNEATNAVFSRDSGTLVTADRSGLISTYQTSTGSETSHFQLKGVSFGSRIALSPDGTLLAITRGYQDYENTISLFDSRTGKELGLLKGHKQGIWHLAFSPDGRTLASSGSGGVIRLWNITTETELLTIDQRGAVISTLTFSPDGRTLIAGSPGFSNNPGLRIFSGLSKETQ